LRIQDLTIVPRPQIVSVQISSVDLDIIYLHNQLTAIEPWLVRKFN
jgi:hypothetical protein